MTPNIQQLEYNWLQNWNEVSSKNFNGAQLEWLNAEMNGGLLNQGQVHQLRYDFLRQELDLTEIDDQPKQYNRLLKDWAVSQGIDNGNQNQIIQDLFEDMESLNFQVLGPRLDGTISIEPQRGVGSATYSRNDVAYQRDFENNYNLVPANEARFQGTRRVQQFVKNSDDLLVWTKTGTATVDADVTDPNGGTTAFLLNLPTNNDQVIHAASGSTIVTGNEGNFSVWLRSDVAGTVKLRDAQHSSVEVVLNVTTEWKRYTTGTFVSNGTFPGLALRRASTTLTSVEAWHPMSEDVSGQSNQSPAQYIENSTGGNIPGRYYWFTNENTVASNVVTENTGLPLHPTKYSLGAKVFQRFDKRADSTAYVVGDRVIPATGSGPAGGNGFYYGVTAITTGTSDSSPPVFPETIGDTVVDGGITLKNLGHYTVAGYLGEPTRTNVIIDSFDLTSWVQTGTAVSALDETGIDGVANKATTLTDDDGAVSENVSITSTISNDSNIHTQYTFIKKDSDETRFPEIIFVLSGGTLQQIASQINTLTGALAIRTSTGTVAHRVEDHGLWWMLVQNVTNNTTGNVNKVTTIHPAQATSIGGADVAATGSIIVGHVQVELNTSIPSSPIETTTVAVERLKDVLTYQSSGNLDDNAGVAFISFTPLSDTGANNIYILGNTGSANLMGYAITNDGDDMRFHQRDGSNIAASDSGGIPTVNFGIITTFMGGARWNDALSNMQISSSVSASSAEITYDGDHGVATLRVINTGVSSSIVSDIRVYDKDLGITKVESLTEYN